MKTFLTLLLESSAAMILFYAVYWFFLRKETFFRLNRFYLIGALLLSLLLPLFPITYAVAENLSGQAKEIGPLQLSATQLSSGSQLSYEKLLLILLAVYLAGAFIVFLRLILQTLSITKTIRYSEITKKENLTIVKNNRYDLPFSFFNLVFYNPGIHLQEDLPGILAHEKVHIREQHWVDLVIAELWSVFWWFNPIVWLYERTIRQNHEFLADAGVLAQGHSPGRYQALLINQLMGVRVAGFTNHLSFAFSATRFKMMSRKEKNKLRVFRLAWVIPVLALLLWAFAEPDYKSRTTENDGKGIPTVSAEKIQGIKVSGMVVTPDEKPLEGTSVILAGTTTGTMTNAEGNFELMIPENQSAVLVFSYVGYVSKVLKIDPSDKDIRLKTNKMLEAVVQIGARYDDKKVPPPPPPPPPPGSAKVKKGDEKTTGMSGTAVAPPPPPPPPPVKESKDLQNAENGKELFIVVEEMPEYPGGEKALQFYIQEMTAKMAQAKTLKGKALVEFTVNYEGNVAGINVKEKENEAVGKAAVDIVWGMKQWKPGTQRGKPVPVKFALPLEF